LPFDPGSEAAHLSGWIVEAVPEGMSGKASEDSKEIPQPADGPITLVVPRHGSELKIVLREAANHDHAVVETVKFPPQSERPTHPRDAFKVAALCMKDGLCEVTGPFSGNSGRTFAAFEDRAATIVAESSAVAYVRIPAATTPGLRPLFIAEGEKVIALPVVVGDFVVKNDGQEIQAGASLIVFPTLEGPEDISDSAWDAGEFATDKVERARKLIPGFSPSGGRCAAQEKAEPEEEREEHDERKGAEEKKDRDGEHSREEREEAKAEGKIVLVVKNRAPEQMSLHGSNDGTMFFCLSDEAFGRGAFKYNLRVDARKDGKVDVRGYVIPFLAPAAGQEFSLKTAQ
jgi:hypothetical protein